MKTNKNSITNGLICELILCKKGMNLTGNKVLTLTFSFIFSSFLITSDVLGCGLNTIGSFTVCVNNNITLSPNLGPNCQNIDYIVWTATDDQNNTVVFATNYAPNINGSVIFNSNTPGIYTINIQGWYNNSPTPFWESNNFGTVHVLDGPPTGNFIPPFVSCSGSPTYIQFNSQNSTSQNLNLPNNSYINYGDGSGNQQLTAQMWNALTGPNGLSYYFPNTGNYTVTLHLENACGSNTFTQEYAIAESIDAIPNHLTICAGNQDSIILSVTVPQGILINWYQGQNLIGSGNPLTIPAPTSNASYQAVPVSNCSYPVVVNVSVITNGSIIINGPTDNCGGDILQYSISNLYGGAVYNWSVSGGQVTTSNSDGTQVTITWDSQNWQGGGTISVTSSNLACLAEAILEVNECCFQNHGATFVIDGNSDADLTTNSILLSEVFNSTAPFTVNPGFFFAGNTYQSLLLGGTVIVDIDFTITNGITVNLLPETRVVVGAGNKLTIDNHSVLKAACDEMWDYILVGGEIIVNNGAVIQDALCGTFSLGNAIITIGNSGDKVEYNKNRIGILVFNHNTPANVQIRNAKFTCRASITTQSNDKLINPHAGEHSAVGILLYRTPVMINIGQGINGMHNIFDNLDFGILSLESQFNAVNNQFMNILDQSSSYDCDCKCPKGTAICADGRGSMSGLIASIGNVQQFQSNGFSDNDYGIYMTENMNALVKNNNLLRTNYDAMSFNNNMTSNGFYEVNDNTSKGVGKWGYHVFMYNNPKTIKEIMRNEVNEQYTPQHLYATGISIHEVVKAPAPVNIIYNDLYNLRTGILLNNANKVVISDNEIELNASPDAIYGAGIIAYKGTRYSILNNTISADNRDNWWVDGIRLEYITSSQVNCNLMQRTASGLFLNGNCTDTYLMQNNLRRNYWGYIINHTITGLQQAGMYSDNIWTGPYDNNTLNGGTYWHTLNMGSNVYDNALNVRPYSGAGNVYKPNPFYADAQNGQLLEPDPVIPNLGPIYYPNGLNYHSGCNLDTTDGAESLMMQQIIAGTYQSPEYTEETKWWLKYQLYEKLNEDSTQNYSDNTLVQFADSMSNAPAGKLLEVQHAINDSISSSVTALLSLKSFNTGIATYNPMEDDYKWINDRMLQAMIEDKDTLLHEYTFNTSNIEEIKSIAEKCPFEYGPAVFLARALYDKISKEHHFFLNPCETANPYPNSGERMAQTVQPYIYDPTEELDMQKLEISNEQKDWSLNVFPNPANEILYIESDKAIHRIEMCDVMGKTIYTVQGNGNQLMNIPVKDFAKGIYLVKVFDQKNSFTTKKLSINH
ncbi:MAG: T9SS type A sorting domain-containing protein [Bacteroidia bacterium]|nr:T9SS type A sorting domain-containing protein [Bacteroidia bacterium]